MKPSRINQVLAEWEGWVDIKPSGRLDGQLVGVSPFDPVLLTRVEIPDYCNDLNAIQRAVMKLDSGQRRAFVSDLNGIIARDSALSFDGCEWLFALANATARQHCEALVKTLGKWEEE